MTPLEMVRLGPSASNKQPWRIVRKDGFYHFFIQRTKGYRNVMTRLVQIEDMQRLDMKSALRAYEQLRTTIPDEPEPRALLINLHFRMGQDAAAMNEIDAYLTALESVGRREQAIQFVESIALEHPNQLEVHKRAAGLLMHAREMTLVTSQWVNSYKRLVPGYEAPVYISWAQRNRSDLIRIPVYKPGKEKATRLEYRSPDPACNPYLAFSVMLAAGLDGIEKKLTPPPPIEENVYEMTPEKRTRLKIGTLPEDLWEAIKVAEKSPLLKECLGDHVFENFIENKKIEWDKFRVQVTNYELDRYLSIL